MDRLRVLVKLNQLGEYKMNPLTCSLSTIDKCFANITVCEHAWGANVVPIFTCERIDAKQENKLNK